MRVRSSFTRSRSGLLQRHRKLVLRGVDGIVFVADSQERRSTRTSSPAKLEDNLREMA